MPHREVRFRRWQVVTAFVVLVAAFTFMGVVLKNDVDKNTQNVQQLQHDKASIHQLEVAGCKIKAFLVTSAAFRLRAAKADTDPEKKAADKRAYRTSVILADRFSNELCTTKAKELK